MKLLQGSVIGLFMLGFTQAAAAQGTVDVKRLPVDLARVTQQLRQSAASESNNTGLHIRYRVDVYGQAPRIDIFTKQDNLATGPVPYGAPTHREMIQHVTPVEFRAPIMDFSALVRWLTDKTNKK